jgi:hypothetical protein
MEYGPPPFALTNARSCGKTSLTTRMHVGRGGALAPYGDGSGTLSETEQGLDQHVRERAYALWKQDGCPEGRADEYRARGR